MSMTFFSDIDDFSRQLCFEPQGARRIAEALAVDVNRDWVALFDAVIEAGVPRVVPPGGRCENGAIEFTNSDGRKHRDDGPAVVSRRGSHFWFKNGKRHRTDGPAVVWRHGHLEWLADDLHHRIDGPAVIAPNGNETYMVRGVYHRINGPAVIRPGAGTFDWYFDGKEITDEARAWMSKNDIRRLPLSDEEAFVLFVHLR